ncbi:MAG: glycosyltransferase family 2 protein [Prevotella sp.]|nr:glycosyltransferase family 2 protein [Prevotella sp.]
MLITVFTPTYNRGHLLPTLYESICRQTFKDFEWIVVDDGSTDNTQQVMEGFMEDEHPFSIRYIKTPNGGKHRAVNRGVKEAKGELFFIADSDDQLTNDALQVVAETYEGVRDNTIIGGVCGLDCQKDGTIIGSGLTQDYLDCNSLDIRFKYHVTGDLKEVFLTRVLKEIPMPEIEGERFSPEALTWNRIAAKYQLRFINRPIYIAEYQPDGLTSSIVRIRMQSPVASMLCYQEMTTYPIPPKEKIKAAINYWRFRLCAKKDSEKPKLRWYWNVFMPLGWLMHKRDK